MAASSEGVIAFGRGLNVAATRKRINPAECSKGENFDLNLDFSGFRRRMPFDLVATATNGQRINGYAQLEAADGTITTLIQAGTAVYLWDGSSTFTLVGNVSASARLRGPRSQNWNASTNVVIITDLGKVETVKVWDGTTFSALSHNLGGSLIAKYALVENEVLFLANVQTTTDTPHVVLASERGDYANFDVSTRPTVTAAVSSPWFLPMPNLKPINGMVEAFGSIVISTVQGKLYRLMGTDAFDYRLDKFYSGSSVAGDEALVNIGNDVIMARQGHIDTLSGTLNFGDVETDDVDRWIEPLVSDVTSWTVAYDPRLSKVYCFPDGGNVVYVMHKSIWDVKDGASPWSKWTTSHSSSFQPTCVMSLKRPSDGIDVVYFGDDQGRIYQMDGSGAEDGGTAGITAFRESSLFRLVEGRLFDNTGWLDYKLKGSNTVTIVNQYAGTSVRDETITLNIPESEGYAVYGGAYYYGADIYYGDPLSERISRQTYGIAAPSGANEFGVRLEVTDGSNDFEFDEIGFQTRVRA